MINSGRVPLSYMKVRVCPRPRSLHDGRDVVTLGLGTRLALHSESGDGGAIRKAITVELRGRGINCGDGCTATNPGWGGRGGMFLIY